MATIKVEKKLQDTKTRKDGLSNKQNFRRSFFGRIRYDLENKNG